LSFVFCLLLCPVLFTSVSGLQSSDFTNDKNTTARPLLFFLKDRPMFVIFSNPFSNKNGNIFNTLTRLLKTYQGCTAATH
jgi:hypothetical protein